MRIIPAVLAAVVATAGVVAPAVASGEPPAPADYVAKRIVTNKTEVEAGERFTRKLVIKNEGEGDGTYFFRQARIVNVRNAELANIVSVGFRYCDPVFEKATGALRYVKCSETYLEPGERAWMRVVYRAKKGGAKYYEGDGVIIAGPSDIDQTNNTAHGPVTVVR